MRHLQLLSLLALPSSPTTSRSPRRRGIRHPFLVLATIIAAAEAAEEGEEQEGADGGADADDDGFVVVDPGFDFAAEGGTFALALYNTLAEGTKGEVERGEG